MDPKTEHKWQERWAEEGIFEPGIDPGKRKYLITVPYPYANDSLHVGHGRTYSTADIVARFHRIMGENVLFPMAFHQSGTPILAFARRMASGDRDIRELYREHLKEYLGSAKEIENTLDSFTEPAAIADFFSNVIINDFKKLGFSIDWTRQFNTAEEIYQKFVTWQFHRLNDAGLIKKGSYPILFCNEEGNAVGEDDIRDGDVDKVSIEELTVVIFKGKSVSLAAASLRPETIYGTTNVWISPEGEYVKCSWNGASIVISRNALEKLSQQGISVDDPEPISARELVRHEFEVPLTGSRVKLFESTFVEPAFGTGIVYSVPGHSIWDFAALQESGVGLHPIKIIDVVSGSETVESLVESLKISGTRDKVKLEEATQIVYKSEFYQGKMNSLNGPYSGLTVTEAREKIRADLVRDGSAFSMYETSRPAQTRTGYPVIVAVMKDQWFIDYSAPWLKEKAHKLVEGMSFYPDQYKKSMHEVIDWLRERPCARKRGLGTRFPFDNQWVIESLSDSTIYPALYTCIVPIRKIHSKLGDVPPEIFDHIFLGKPLKDKHGCSGEIEEASRLFKYWYGVDIRITAIPHFSNHLAFYLMNHAALFPADRYPGAIAISGLVTSQGAKISKSKGNVVSLTKISGKYTADIYRLFMAVSADTSSVVDWNETDLASVRKKYDQFVNLVEEFHHPPEKRKGSFAQDWFEASFRQRLSSFKENMEKMRVRDGVVSVFFDVMNDLRKAEAMGADRNNLFSSILSEWLIAISCAIPHTAESLWQKHFPGMGLVSSAILGTEGVSEKDRELIESEAYLQGIIEDVREIGRVTGRTYSRLELRVSGAEHLAIAKAIISGKTETLSPSQRKVIGDFMKVRKNVRIHDFDEYTSLMQGKEILEKSLGLEVSISRSVPTQTDKNPWPGRPLIFLS